MNRVLKKSAALFASAVLFMSCAVNIEATAAQDSVEINISENISGSQNQIYVISNDILCTVDANLKDGAVCEAVLTIDGIEYARKTAASGGQIEMMAENAPYGIHSLKVSLLKDEVIRCAQEVQIAVIKPYEIQPMQYLTHKGYSTRLNSGAENAQYIETLLKNSGAQMIRDGREWRWIEKEPGVYDFDAADGNISSWENGEYTDMAYVLSFNNDLYSGRTGTNSDKYGPNTKENIDAFARYAKTVAQSRPDIKFFEVWNEPNGQTTGFWKTDVLTDNPMDTTAIRFEDYTYLLQTVYNAIKSVREDAVVCAGALAGSDVLYIQRLLDNGGYGYFDCFTIHPYYGGDSSNGYEAMYAELQEYLNQHGGWKFLGISEVGRSSYLGTGEDFVRQTDDYIAKELTKQLVIGDKSGFLFQNIYTFTDTGDDETNPEHRFGVVGRDMSVKPQYAALKEHMERTAGAKYIGCLQYGGGAKVHIYNKNGENVAAAWADGSFEVNFGNESISVYDLNGTNIAKNVSSVTLSESPVYITGLSVNWIEKAIYESFIEKTEKLILTYPDVIGGYVEEIDAASAALIEKNITWENIDSFYKMGTQIINNAQSGAVNITDEHLYSILFAIYGAGDLLLEQYALNFSFFNQGNEERLSALKAIAEDSGDMLNAMLDYAEYYMGYAKKLGEENSMPALKRRAVIENGISYILDWASLLASDGKDAAEQVLFYVPSSQRLFFKGVNNQLEISAYNESSETVSGKFILYNANNAAVGETDFDLEAYAEKGVALEFVPTYPQKDYTLSLTVDGEVKKSIRVSANTFRDPLPVSGDNPGYVYEVPYAKNVQIKKSEENQDALSAEFSTCHSLMNGFSGSYLITSYSVDKNAVQDLTAVEWLMSDTEYGVYKKIGEGQNFNIDTECIGKYIKARVKPRVIIPVTVSKLFGETTVKEYDKTGYAWNSEPIYINRDEPISVSVSGVPQAGKEVHVNHNIQGEVSYQWQSATGGAGAFYDIPGAVSESLMLTNDLVAYSDSAAKFANSGNQCSRRIRVLVTDRYGNKYQSDEINTERALGPVMRIENMGGNKLALSTKQEQTPRENVFRLEDGSEFILLDDFGNEGYFVLAKDFYGKHEFDTSGKQKFNPENPNNIAYWLNNEFLQNGNGGKILPEEIRNNIIRDREWLTESGPSLLYNQKVLSDIPNDYVVNTGVVLLSQNELLKYCGKIGLLDSMNWQENDAGWSLRTVRGFNGQSAGDYLYVTFRTGRQYQTMPALLTEAQYIRPAFFLNSEFFKNVKIDLNNSGENVLEIIRNSGSSLYNANELYNADSVQIKECRITGSDGNNVEQGKLCEHDELNAEILLAAGYDNMSISVAAAAYDNEDKLVSLSYKPIPREMILKDKNFSVSVIMSALRNRADYIKIFVWDGLNAMSPLSETYIVK